MVSAGNGPLQAMPRFATASTVGRIISISSRPNRPPSPACGLSAATAMRGLAIPPAHHPIDQLDRIGDTFGVDAVEGLAKRLRPVTRDIHWPSSTFISEK